MAPATTAESIELGPFPYRATILDPIHKEIKINILEYNLLQTPFTRRLHNVKQLGLAYLIYPQAKHSRFEHSLGVAHLSGQIAARLASGLLARPGEAKSIFTKETDKSVRNFVGVARLAGLLHDLGHPPYSHSLENVFEKVASSDDGCGGSLSGIGRVIDKVRQYKIKLHEYATIHFALKMKEFIEEKMPEEAPQAGAMLDSALEVLSRTWTGSCTAPSDSVSIGALEELGISEEGAALLASIISNDLADSDRLDYLLRDAYNTGVVFGTIDYHRLIDNLYVSFVRGVPRLALGVKGLPAIEHVIEARYRMYRIVYFHHKQIALNIALGEAFKELLNNWDEAALPSYRDCIDKPYNVMDPEVIARCIEEEFFLYDDSEFDVMIRNLLRIKGRPRRWAASLFSDRRLLPISLIKRPESFIYLILDWLFDSVDSEALVKPAAHSMLNPLILQFKDRLSRLVSEDIDVLKGEIARIVGSETGLREDEVKVDVWTGLIGGGGGRNEASCRRIEILGRESTLYVRLVEELSSIPLLSAYVYSDDVELHLRIYKVRGEIRRKTEKAVERILLNAARA
ncbi:HD domain-containing protein [Stetteria hydrogenophila]